MTFLIGLIPALPLLGFVILALSGKLIPKKAVAFIGVGSVMLSAVITIYVGLNHLSCLKEGNDLTANIYTWVSTGGFTADISFVLDSLSLVFCFVITFVGTLIHLYSVEFMKHEDGFSRYFAYMNLFVGSMLILVLASNLLLLYLGWEGVGLCSYLLISFWYKVPEFGYAGRKAFIVTRIGDTAMLLGLFLLFISFGTMDIKILMNEVADKWNDGSPLVVVSALLLLGGAVGKSAQLPLQTWLPDAMAGPSPVSALIHAATMVTAGVYLIARTHVLFSLSPVVMHILAIIGAATLLIAGFSALAQTDLKRILAYSTISQIGYMFLAMGIGAWSAAIFHFMIHAFFKALLFLSGGAVIHLLNDEHNIFKMGGLWKKMPVVFLTFLTGGASLSALPLITAGFYSKDQILWFGWSAIMSSPWLWLAGITGALITSVYTFRMIFITFFGDTGPEPDHRPGALIYIPLITLAVLSLAGGFIEMPENMGSAQFFSGFLHNFLPPVNLGGDVHAEIIFQFLSAVVSLGGVWIAFRFFNKKSAFAEWFSNSRFGSFFFNGWGFDRVYNVLFVKPVVWLSEIDQKDIIDLIYKYIAKGTNYFHILISKTQNGKLRWYALVFSAGIVILLALMILL
jgi:NADH-quinone oxidoreductase subunit L